MEILHALLFFAFVLSGFSISMYEGFTVRKGWSLDANFKKQGRWLGLYGNVILLGGIIVSFFEFRWWVVLVGALLAWFLSGFFILFLKRHAPITVMLLSIISLVGIIIYKIFVADI